MIAILAFDAGEAFSQIDALEVFSDYMRNYRLEKTVLQLEEIVIAFLKLEKVVTEELPQGSLLRFSSPVYRHIAAVFHNAPLLPTREQS